MAQCVYVLEFIQTMSCTLIIDFQHLKYIYLVIPYTLKGVLSKNLQKPYICGRGGYNSWGDGTYHVDTLGPTKTQGYRINP